MPFVPPAPVVARVEGMKTLIRTKYPNQEASRAPLLEPAAFLRRIHPVTIRQAELELAAGLFRSAEKTARRGTESGLRDATPWILLGRALAGQRTKPIPNKPGPSIAKVREAYQEALRRDSRSASAVRELAMSYYKTNGTSRSAEDSQKALEGFRRYLRLDPKAKDREYVETYIQELSGGGR